MAYLRSPLETNPTVSRESTATGFRRLAGLFPRCDMTELLGMQWRVKLRHEAIDVRLINTLNAGKTGGCLLGLSGFPNGLFHTIGSIVSVHPNVCFDHNNILFLLAVGFSVFLTS